MRFRDRTDAGRILAHALEPWRGRDAVVLGIPRGGVAVAREVASALGLPLDITIVRKLGVPFQPELAMGAIGEGGVFVLNDEVIASAKVSQDQFAATERQERADLHRRVTRLRAGQEPARLDGKIAIVVDDGFATGATAIAAANVARARGASSVVLAAPIGSMATIERLRTVADEVVTVAHPTDFIAVGAYYDHFEPTSDAEVRRLLDRSMIVVDREVLVDLADGTLPARLTIPQSPRAVVIFAHGSGSSRHSPRNRHVADRLAREGFATLLLDLLTPSEEHLHSCVFDVDLLSTRLSGSVAWARTQPALQGVPVFVFGASTGSAAALAAAARHGSDIAGIVSRGGRPDLVTDSLGHVTCPVLLIVGGADDAVLRLNREALGRMGGKVRLSVVPGSGHLFEEPGALDEVTALACDWLLEQVAVEQVPASLRL